MHHNIVLACTLLIAGAVVCLAEMKNANLETNAQELSNFPASRKSGKLYEMKTKDMESKHFNQIMDPVEVAEGGRTKIKIKKKHKKFLKEALMVGLLAKSALLPLAVGFLKLLTGKALFMTMLALGLALALTFKSATEKTVTTEVINLVPHHQRHKRSTPEVIGIQLATAFRPKNYN